ncbi:shikimate dehydrogenase [Desulfosarcina sp. BuS5]|uniref:shikimate dehydrogenase n=1 Tax=Desulfosarcina sp. BuS5 TaxID=933262 RepID=UPI000482C55A|nr:shikimate dehydrogenase [Desulfosarcina sp. BuS5]WDN87734.1 shikimate dehydrogenase [Desulfosarcina sp. BuS5]
MKISATTSTYCVIGDPIAHSLSPVMHNAAFQDAGYNGAYLAFNVKDVASAMAGFKGLGIKGASVTIPHKIAVMEFLDHIDETAVKIGAVNTIVNKDGKLLGYNTDCLGATRALLEKTEIKDKQVVLAGAGGAARAIGFGILAEGGSLTIINILEDEGKNLANDLGVNYYPLEHFKHLDCDILINATPLGMTPNINDMVVEGEYLGSGMTVMDIVYNPLKTRLLKEAEAIGCNTVDGVSMFVYQGVAQFEMWTGLKSPVELMRGIVVAALGENA